jgi:hypothetical protein
MSDGVVKTLNSSICVIPAKAVTQRFQVDIDSGIRRNDVSGVFYEMIMSVNLQKKRRIQIILGQAELVRFSFGFSIL